MELAGQWNFPTSVRFGRGRLRELPAACAELGIERPLLVTDRGIAALPSVAAALASLQQAGLAAALFGGVDPNPDGANLDAGLAAYRNGNHDGVVAFGGGSGLAGGRALVALVGHEVDGTGDRGLRQARRLAECTLLVSIVVGALEVGLAGRHVVFHHQPRL